MRTSAWMITSCGILLALSGTARAEPVAPRTAFEVPAQYRLIDGIATDGSTVWVASVVDRVVVAHRGDGFRAMPLPTDIGRPRGMAYDAARDLIWIATDCPAIADAGPCTTGGVLAIDRNGKVRKHLVVPGGVPHFFSQVSVDLYQVTFTEARTGDIFVCRNQCDRLNDSSTPAGKNGAVQIDEHDKRLLDRPRAAGPSPFSGMTVAGTYVVAGQRLGARSSIFAFQMGPNGPINLKTLAQGAVVPESGQIAASATKVFAVADSQWSSYAPGAAVRAQRPTPILQLSVPQ